MTTARSRPRVALAHLAYLLLLHLACAIGLWPWLVRALRDRRQWSWMAGRLGRLPGSLPAGRPVWVHAVSVGEVKASRRLLEALRQRGLPVVLSTGTIAGWETARALFPGTCVLPWPLDLPWVVGPVLRAVAPRLVLTVELELWPTFMRLADRAGVPQALVNGRLGDASFRTYRRLSWWLPEFDRLALVSAQTAEHGRRLVELGVAPGRVHVCGNLKHDLAQAAPAAEVEALGRELGLPGAFPVFLAGSTHAGEDELVLEAWQRAGGSATSTLVLVPRHVDRVPEIQRLLARRGLTATLRSAARRPRAPAAILLVDTLGELEPLFGLADVVFLGGSLVPVGGHNLLEPAAAGRPILVGPHLESCRVEAEALGRAGGLRVVPDASALGEALGALLAAPDSRRRMGEAARAGRALLSGGTEALIDVLQAGGLLGRIGPGMSTGIR